MAALGFGQWILYFMPRYQMTSYDNALEYEDNRLKSSGKSFAPKTAVRKFIETEKKMLRNDYIEEHVGFKARIQGIGW